MNTIFVTGAAGFIGSHLSEALVRENYRVIGWDNFSTGQRAFLKSLENHPRFRLIEGDNLDLDSLTQAMKGSDAVFHLAANADVRFGLNHPDKDVTQNMVATFHVLEAMRRVQIRTILFSSSASVYGEASVVPTPESAPFPVQTSLYGASKLGAEGLIEAYGEGYGMKGAIFRFVSILGERYSHGHVFDFYKQLLRHPDTLEVLGDGSQRKSYLYVQDCVEAMILILGKKMEKKKEGAPVAIYNLGTPEYCRVSDSVEWISKHLGLNPRVEYEGSDRGWIGDNPFIFLDITKIQLEGWSPKVSIRQGILKTLDWLRENHWILERT